MKEKDLPESYKGYATKELLDLWKAIREGTARGTPKEKIMAMDGLLRDYGLGIHDPELHRESDEAVEAWYQRMMSEKSKQP